MFHPVVWPVFSRLWSYFLDVTQRLPSNWWWILSWIICLNFEKHPLLSSVYVCIFHSNTEVMYVHIFMHKKYWIRSTAFIIDIHVTFKDWNVLRITYVLTYKIIVHCKCLQGFTGTLRENRSVGKSNLRGLHVYSQSL